MRDGNFGAFAFRATIGREERRCHEKGLYRMKTLFEKLNAHLAAVLLVSGGAVLAVGVGLIFLPAGVIAGGLELLFAGVLVAAGDAYAKEKEGDVSG